MIVSHFAGARRPAAIRCEDLEWSAFVDLFRTPLPNDTPKMALPLWSPAKFTNDYRDGKNVERVFALTFDVDKQPIPTVEELRNLQLKAVVSTSSSSTAAARRYRLAIALTRPVTGAEYEHIWSVIAARLPFPVGKEARDPSRAWFVPRAGADGTYECFEVEGAPLDVDAVLAQALPVPAPATPAPDATPPVQLKPDVQRAAAAASIAAAWPAPGNRCSARLALRGACWHAKLPQDEAAALVKLVHAQIPQRGEETDAKIDHDVADTYAVGARGEPVAGWKSLADAIGEQVADAAHGLIDPFFAYGRARATGTAVPSDAPAQTPAAPEDWSTKTRFGGWNVRPSPPLYLVDGLIPAYKVVTWFAEGGSLKTWGALDLAIAVASGRPWLGKFPVRTGPSLYLDWEDGPYEVARRIYMLTGGADVPNLGYRYAGPQIDKEAFWQELAGFVKARGITLVMCDSLNAAMPGDAEENDTRFAQGVKLAGKFTEIGCTVGFVHHANKQGSIRGTSAIRDASDVVFGFEPVSETDDLKRMRMVCNKPGPQKRPKPINVELAADGATGVKLGTFEDEAHDTGRNATKAVDVKAAILLAISQKPMCGYREIAEATGLGEDPVRDALRIMKENGTVVQATTKSTLYPGDATSQRARIVATMQQGGPMKEAELVRRAGVTREAVAWAVSDHVLDPSTTNRTDPLRYLILRAR